ncbi:MAG: manganese efflux pump [Candidatus Krumholzibacteria bacterium]|nr:manganese efflux pump [Candidatus Krumholzibacteria bacterium]
MVLLDVLLLAVGLAMDACVVSAGAGAGGRSSGGRATFRLAFHFGLFQFFMPILGWFAGAAISGAIDAFDHWIAFGILGIVGVRMIRAGLKVEEDTGIDDPSKGWSLIMLSIATSIDALAVGFSLAMIEVDIWFPAVVIGIVTAAMSVVGLKLGARLGARFGKRMEVVGGVILVFVGASIVFEHLTGV